MTLTGLKTSSSLASSALKSPGLLIWGTSHLSPPPKNQLSGTRGLSCLVFGCIPILQTGFGCQALSQAPTAWEWTDFSRFPPDTQLNPLVAFTRMLCNYSPGPVLTEPSFQLPCRANGPPLLHVSEFKDQWRAWAFFFRETT